MQGAATVGGAARQQAELLEQQITDTRRIAVETGRTAEEVARGLGVNLDALQNQADGFRTIAGEAAAAIGKMDAAAKLADVLKDAGITPAAKEDAREVRIELDKIAEALANLGGRTPGRGPEILPNVAEEARRLNREINEALGGLLAPTSPVEETTAAWEAQFDAIEALAADFALNIQSIIGTAIGDLAAGIGQALAGGGGGGIQQAFAGLLNGLGDVAIRTGLLAIGIGNAIEAIKASLAAFTGAGAIVAGGALIALGVAAKAGAAAIGAGAGRGSSFGGVSARGRSPLAAGIGYGAQPVRVDNRFVFDQRVSVQDGLALSTAIRRAEDVQRRGLGR